MGHVSDTGTNGNSLGMNDMALKHTSDSNNNTEQFLRRKVRDNWKLLLIDFKHVADATGNMKPTVLRQVLYKYDILPSDKMWASLCREMDDDGDGLISFNEFMTFFGKGDEKHMIKPMLGVKPRRALDIIREKVSGKLASGPSVSQHDLPRHTMQTARSIAHGRLD